MADRIETVTILFTDLVGSTELLQRAGDEHAQRVLRAHHRLLREAVDLHGGHEVKWLGDGLMVAFPSATDALRCAIKMQQAARRPAAGERLQVRVGLNVGETIRDETDYFGTPVVVARRLCDHAQGGQIVASELVVRLLEGSHDFAFQRLGDLKLKGIAEGVAAAEVLYQNDPLALLRHTPFVGRRHELGRLETALAAVRAGSGAVVLLAGEPGIGKTRLADEFCAQAHALGAAVARGGCYEGDISAPYRPWVEALRAYASQSADDALRGELGPGAPEVATLLPELRQRFTDIEQAPRLQPEAERLRLFDSTAQFLRNGARAQPLVLFLDDLHWADRPSLLLLQHVARVISKDRLLVLGTYRDVEVDRGHPLAETLAALRRHDHVQRVPLRGLPQKTIDELLAAIEPSEEVAAQRQALAAVLFQETEGNPFFIRELLSHLIETGKLVHEGGHWTTPASTVEELGIPEGVREVIGGRLARLSAGCNRMLTRASTMSGGFTWAALKAICAEPEQQILGYLDEALAAQVVEERAGAAGAYDFTHALIRHTLYEELSTPRRALLHQEIGEALERLYATNQEPHLAELAHHFSRAAAGQAEKAVAYAARAGERAMSLFAWEEAAQHYERALHGLELMPAPDSTRRCELLLLAAEAQFNARQIEPALTVYRQAVEAARLLGTAQLLGRAAVGFENTSDTVFGDIELRREALALLDEALEALGGEDSVLRVRALNARIRPAAALTGGGQDLFITGGFGAWAGQRDPELVALARDSVAMARRLGDASLTAMTLDMLHNCIYGPGNAQERLAITKERLEGAQVGGNVAQEVGAYAARLLALLELGDLAGFRDTIDEITALAKRTRQMVPAWFAETARAMLATAEGRFAEAERLIFEQLAFGQQVGTPDAATTFGGQLYQLRRLQGRLGEAEAIFQDAVSASPNIPAYRAALALLYYELGRPDAARRELDLLAARHFADVPQDFLWLASMTLLSDVCAGLEDTARAERLYALLLPHAQLNSCIAHIVSDGSVSRSLGQLAAVLGLGDEAERHFETAIETNGRMGFRAWLTVTQLQHARALLRRAARGETERARALLGEALAAGEEMGMGKVSSECRRLLEHEASPA